MAEFKHFDLRLVDPTFNSPLTGLILELDHLRKKRLHGSTKPIIFFQLKNIFHMLESIASARIEGNRTTIIEYIDAKIEEPKSKDTEFLEIQNMEECLEFIENNIDNSKIDRAFISELHKIIVQGLPWRERGEGDETPGLYRLKQVHIKQSSHVAPEPTTVSSFMDELFEFIGADDEPKYDLLKTAIAHHRFVWVHPFTNGNGRTVRMLTYAMLLKYGFNVGTGRILNPSAVFCSDRENYYRNLGLADTGTDKNLLIWCEYVLNGLKDEIEKIDKLLEYDFLKGKILLPAIAHALERKWITGQEFKVFKIAIEKQVIQASDLNDIVPSRHPSDKSRLIRRLREKKMLMPITGSSRKYAICFQNNYLLRGVIKALFNEELITDN